MHKQWRWRGVGLFGVLASLALPAAAAMQAKPLEWTIGKDTFSGVLVYDDAGAAKRPGLVMVPNWRGVNDSAVTKAKQLAGDDYVVLVADVYGKGKRPANDSEAGQFAGALKKDPPTLRARALKAVDVLKAQAGKAPLDASRIGAVGFCFGGTTVLELVRAGAQLAGVVSLHGGIATPSPAAAGSARTPLLVLNGADDKSVSKADIAAFETEMNAAGADWQFVNFSGAVHCFAEADANSPPGCLYNPRAAKRAYRMLGDFFDERFGD
ncbi:dienelactone hydrolase family protein [Xanthomonas arboricola pv. corylina]|uniref:Dienelactone hydrolase domain-containing protein n=2 Tax=Xanthomonas arboricola TaxID=56448 RepID=A0AAN2E3X0_9XANT|nr:dienelactone hydrolase family protein [Xanthomonas arboricola]KER84465.1 dienelactone hydrolase [Xanthomonas arboricola pv. celebensis]MCC8669746.1 dienelactone hydrolase family protein [Xanthomonas arboricola]MDN0202295.1 dienelactone hydrolase family protein [Xanthomonas arboricola pv. corylina]MDN0205744.1 dienelactone hydrolase family protein [Xanthomonas arboricola pv. corylina]MDN0210072.1 dienelactone hydrolase family protein [Xanthomonas arboricola pv. corylina]